MAPGYAPVGVTPAMGNSGLATTSMILGLVGLCIGGIFLGIPAVICGHMALNRINQSNGLIGGKGMAITGLVLGYLEIVASLLYILVLMSNNGG